MPKLEMKTNKPAAKVLGATGGAAASAPIGQTLIWLIETYARVDLPLFAEATIMLVVAAAAAFIGGYITRPAERDMVKEVK